MRLFTNQRGVVSVQWILLSIIVALAVVLAFGPQWRGMLTAGMQAVSSAVSAQAAAGS